MQVPVVSSNVEKCIGWSFADMNTKEMKKKIVEPISVIVIAALFPYFEKGTKIGLAGRKITVWSPSDLTVSCKYFTLDACWVVRRLYGEDINNLKVFDLNAVKAAELHDPLKNENVRALFDFACTGIVAAKEAYADQSTPKDVINKYQGTISDAAKGKFDFTEGLSDAEDRVRRIWTQEEIDLVNKTIIAIQKNCAENPAKEPHKINITHLNYLLKLIDEKQNRFIEIYHDVKEKKVSIIKYPKKADSTPPIDADKKDDASEVKEVKTAPKQKEEAVKKDESDASEVKEVKGDLKQKEEADKAEGGAKTPPEVDQTAKQEKPSETQPKSNSKRKTK